MRNEWETLDHIRDWETKLMAQNVMPQGDPSKDEVLRQINIMPLDLPPLDTKRWVPRRKAVIVNAVSCGAISLEESLSSLPTVGRRVRGLAARD